MTSFDKVNGFLLVDKPQGITSFKVVQILRRVTGVKKIGHSGTLDPLATGLMICAIGRQYTKQLDSLMRLNKTYTGTAILGQSTDTYDADGEITKERPVPESLSLDDLNLARKGEEVVLEKKPVTIYEFNCSNLKHGNPTTFDFEIACSKGTYIRSLAHDLGESLGAGGHIQSLRRSKIEDISVDDAVPLDDLTIDIVLDNLYAAL